MKHILFKAGYKFQLVETYFHDIIYSPMEDIKTPHLGLSTKGLLVIKRFYAWDGPSGPTFDTPNFMRGSLVHDALYQLMRMELIPQSFRKMADYELYRICRQDGMGQLRAWMVWTAVKHFGKSAASPDNVKEVLKAP